MAARKVRPASDAAHWHASCRSRPPQYALTALHQGTQKRWHVLASEMKDFGRGSELLSSIPSSTNTTRHVLQMKAFLLCACLLALCSISAATDATGTSHYPRPINRQRPLYSVGLQDTYDELYYSQTLDHFSASATTRWNHRYLMNNRCVLRMVRNQDLKPRPQ